LGDPVPVWGFHGAAEDLSASSRHPLYGGIDIADIKVVEPATRRHRRRFCHHPADRFPSDGELLIEAHRTDVRSRLLPSKKFAVEIPRFLVVGGEEFMPADAAEAETINGSCLASALPFEQGEYCHQRVGHDRKAADVQDILRWKMYRTAKPFDAVRNGVDVIDVDVSDPHGALAPVPRCFREFHHPAHRIVPRSKNRVRQTGHRRIASAPAHYLGIEGASQTNRP
jgi:hypothetical protein